jgi:putative salt-induced outer membrane protein YdiY
MIRSFIHISFFLFSITAYAQESEKPSPSPPPSNATAADIVASLETPIQAQKTRTPPLITGSAELGFLYKTGNTNSGDIKTGMDIRFEKGSWLSLLNIDLLLKKSDVADDNGKNHFKTTDQKWTLASQTNYSLDNKEKNYVYGNIWFEESEFSSFVNQSSISTGWGHHWYKNNNASLWGDIGPGYKRDLFKATDTEPQRTADTWIIQAQALYIRKLGEHIEFKQRFSIKQAIKSSENSIYKAETTVLTKLISTLQLKFTFTLDYNSEVETERKNLDTQTAVTLVYSF